MPELNQIGCTVTLLYAVHASGPLEDPVYTHGNAALHHFSDRYGPENSGTVHSSSLGLYHRRPCHKWGSQLVSSTGNETRR